MRAASIALLATLACGQPTEPPPAPPPQHPWSPPAWLDHPDAEVLSALGEPPATTRGPRIRAESAIVADLDRGLVLWARDADKQRPIASVTKLAAALALVSLKPSPDLDRVWCVDAELYPPDKGAVSRFETGVCHPGWDFIGAALVHSDNRGAMALPWLAGVPYHDFVNTMVDVVAELGGKASFSDPAGLDETDKASARDVLRMVVASSMSPLISDLTSAPSWQISRRRGTSMLPNTNRLLPRWETLAAKTGYTSASGYCLAVVVRAPSGARIAAVVLGAPTASARFNDVAAMVQWAEQWEAPKG